MEMTVREARSQFASALAAAERGERVTITKHGKAIAEIGPPTPVKKKGLDWEAMARYRKEHGLDQIKLEDGWRERFDDPAFSREVLGIGDDWDPTCP